jgi:MvaI/BcnI restriction endonuclease family
MTLAFADHIFALREAGAIKIYAKKLSPNDNSKNQIYLAGDPARLSQIPSSDFIADAKKPGILKASVEIHWIAPGGGRTVAPHSQLIFYPQYPEVRLSGVLKAAEGAPNEIIASRLPNRFLMIGVTDSDAVLATAGLLTDDIDRFLEDEIDENGGGILRAIRSDAGVDSKTILLRNLSRIHKAGWIASKSLLSDGSIRPCHGNRCVGHTLEAELGVPQNGTCGPDFMDWEIKASTYNNYNKVRPSQAVTLITPAPSSGAIADLGVADFIRRFGYPAKSGAEDRLNFGGTFFYGAREPNTGLTLGLPGYDIKSAAFPEGGGVALFSDAGEIAAMWDFAPLVSRWKLKHAFACYVPAESKPDPTTSFRYGNKIRLGTDPHIRYFFKSILDGSVYLDPGLKLEGATSSRPRTKERYQFRVRNTDLSRLYENFWEVDVCGAA